jgi:hypothetical protein
MALDAPLARAALGTTCRAATTLGGLAVSPGVVFLGLAALGVVGFIAYHALRNDYEVSIEEAGVGPLKLKGIHLVKLGSSRAGRSPTTPDLAVEDQQHALPLPHQKPVVAK